MPPRATHGSPCSLATAFSARCSPHSARSPPPRPTRSSASASRRSTRCGRCSSATARSASPSGCSTGACRAGRDDAAQHAPAAPLGPSRAIVVRLAALFSVDAFAGGLVVNSLLALWLFERFGLSLTQAAAFFFWTGLLSAGSQLAAPRVAARIGLLNTMVFTHLPANVCLVARGAGADAAARAGAAVRPQRAVADGRADAHRLRDGRRHAGRADRRGELHRGAAQPCGGPQPDPERRVARRRMDRACRWSAAACSRSPTT